MYITFTLDESFKNGVVFVLNKLCNCTSATVGNWCCKLLWRLTCSYLCIPFIVNLMLNIDGCWYYSHQSLLVQIILQNLSSGFKSNWGLELKAQFCLLHTKYVCGALLSSENTITVKFIIIIIILLLFNCFLKVSNYS